MLDTKTILKAAGLVAASANGTGFKVGGGRIKARMVVDVSVIEIADGDEGYDLHFCGGDDSDFTNWTTLACLSLGAQSSGIEGNVDSTIGRHELMVSNEKNGVIYPYVRLRTVVAGTVGTGINFAARLEEL